MLSGCLDLLLGDGRAKPAVKRGVRFKFYHTDCAIAVKAANSKLHCILPALTLIPLTKCFQQSHLLQLGNLQL